MKKYISTLFFFAALLPMHLFSQSDQEDVIYTKNGSTYRGSITEQIPGVSYKIEIAGGSVIVLSATDVTKVAREPKFVTESTYIYRRGKPIRTFQYHQKGYFFQAQLEAEIPEAGFRLVNGYKFNQFAYLGLGLGVDGVISDLHGNSDYAGAYLPIYIYYGGDILHQQITPFYTVEAGYTWRPDILVNDNYDYYSGGGSVPIGGHGGFMAGAGFGVRFYSRRRVHFDISAHVDYKMSTEHYEYDNYNSNNGYATSYFYSTNEFLIIPGFRVGIGF
jgi:hypothetical protein